MKKFKFRLEKVFQYRISIQDDKKRILTEYLIQIREQEDKLANYLQEQDKNSVSEYNNLAGYQLQTVFATRLSTQINKTRDKISELEKLAEEARVEYVEATKDVQSLETLKKKQLEEYQQYVHKMDEKFLDELTVQKGNRLQGE